MTLPSSAPSGWSAWRRAERVAAVVFFGWAGFLVLAVLARDGWTADNGTRVAVVVWLAMTIVMHLICSRATRRRRTPPSRRRFVLSATGNALVVEVCYMPTRPLWPALRIDPQTPASEVLTRTLIDVLATAPFYLLLFSLVWWLVARARTGVVGGTLLCAFGMAMGDGNAFFLASPASVWLAPWVMLNYVPALLTPLMQNAAALPTTSGARAGWWLVTVPALVVTYWCCGAVLLMLGRALGYA